jgi:hypothetical protein
VIVGLVSVVIILVNQRPAGSTTKAAAAASTSAVKPVGVGQVERWTDGGGDSGTIEITAAQRHAPRPQYAEHPTAGSWLVINVTVHVDKGQAEVNQYVFAAQTPDGVEHQGTSTPLDDMLSATLTAGRDISGQIGFDVPAGQNYIDWTPSGGPPLATFRVDA